MTQSRQPKCTLVARLKAEGFDRSYRVRGTRIAGRTMRSARVACSQCAPLVICGVSTHEAGCPNIVHSCKGCDARVSRAGAYCVDCS